MFTDNANDITMVNSTKIVWANPMMDHSLDSRALLLSMDGLAFDHRSLANVIKVDLVR